MAAGAERIARGGEAGAWVDAVAALLDSPHAPTRVAAAALAYNLALALPRKSDAAGRLVDGLARRALPPPGGGAAALDAEVGLRVLLALGRVVFGGRDAARRLRALAPDPLVLAGTASPGDMRLAVAEDLRRLLAAVPDQ